MLQYLQAVAGELVYDRWCSLSCVHSIVFTRPCSVVFTQRSFDGVHLIVFSGHLAASTRSCSLHHVHSVAAIHLCPLCRVH